MMRLFVFLAVFGAAASAKVLSSAKYDLISSDVAGKKLKLKYSYPVSIAGEAYQFEGAYSLGDRSLFGEYVSVSGMTGDVKYKLTQRLRRLKDWLQCEFEVCKDIDGTKLTVVGDVGNQANDVKLLKAIRSVTIGEQRVMLAPSYSLKSKLAKLKLSTKLVGDALTADAELAYSMNKVTRANAAVSLDVSYDVDLGDVGSLTATLHPLDQSASLELTESKTGLTASTGVSRSGLGKLQLKRGFDVSF